VFSFLGHLIATARAAGFPACGKIEAAAIGVQEGLCKALPQAGKPAARFSSVACCREVARVDSWKGYLEQAAGARLALDRNSPGMVLNDAVAHRKTQSRSLADLLGGEERVIDLGQVLGTDSNPGVAETDDHCLICRLRRDFQATSIRHCIPSVDDQVHEDLLKLWRASRRVGQVRRVIAHYLDIGVPQLRLQQLDRIVKHSMNIDITESRISHTREIEKIIDY